TIEKSRGLQTPEMLEQLKLRWISKLNDLCLGVTKDEKSDRAHEWVPSEMEVMVPKLDGVFPVKIESYPVGYGNSHTSTTSSSYHTSNSNIVSANDFGIEGGNIQKKRAYDGYPPNVPIPIISSKEMKLANEINTDYEICRMAAKRPNLGNTNKEERGEKEKQDSKYTSPCNLEKINNEDSSNIETNQDGCKKDDYDEFEDDEFGDASWDIVASKSGQADNSTGQSSTNQDINTGRNTTTTGEPGTLPDDELLSEQGSDLDNVSDLDDEEPECSDVIIGHFEKVVRPYTRKKNQKGKWRVKLRNGIAQIANQEIPFDTLIGEFEF
ncbi:hypothetical protein OJ253_3157, partial [Cryptosporidium canis]